MRTRGFSMCIGDAMSGRERQRPPWANSRDQPLQHAGAVPAVVVSIVAFVLGFVGSMPVAGPISVMVVSRTAEGNWRAARRIAYGASVAEALYAFLAFW